jgi:hypothetical protein
MLDQKNVFDVVAEDPRCAAELAEELGIKIGHVRASLGWLRIKYPPDRWGRRVVFISEWRRSAIRGRLYLRAVYSIGLHRDEPSPGPLTITEYNQRRRERLGVANSIFTLGQQIVDRRVVFDWRQAKNPSALDSSSASR